MTDPKLAFLQAHGAGTRSHSDAHLLAHLQGTALLLRTWGERQAVQDAGLFHSVYGTESYQSELLPPQLRGQVEALIGHEAEALAHAFGRLQKASFYAAVLGELDAADVVDRTTGEPLALTHDQRVDLCHLSVANWLEQRPRAPETHQFIRATEFAAMRPVLRAATRHALDAAYGFGGAS